MSALLPESKLFKGTPAEPAALTRPVRSEGHLSPESGDTPAEARRTSWEKSPEKLSGQRSQPRERILPTIIHLIRASIPKHSSFL